jgi:hypothetical protein
VVCGFLFPDDESVGPVTCGQAWNRAGAYFTFSFTPGSLSERVFEKPVCRSMGILPMSRRAIPHLRGGRLWPCKPSLFHGRDARGTHGQDARATFQTPSEKRWWWRIRQ